jgi:monoamine oxidase
MLDAIVCGAGIAGLTACTKFRKLSQDVQVLEARSYIGGHVFTKDREVVSVSGRACYRGK